MKPMAIGKSEFTAMGALMLSAVFMACGSAPEQKQAAVPTTQPAPAAKTGPQVKVSPALKAKADSPKPGPKAKKKAATASIGSGKAVHSGAGHAKADRSFWVEEVDIDDDGNPEVVDVARDDKHKVLYLAKEKAFACANGASADGQVLIAIYGTGNTYGKPAGSGWFVAELDAGECAVAAAGLYGCKFDSSGDTTECGSAVVQEETDDVIITPAPSGPGSGSGVPKG